MAASLTHLSDLHIQRVGDDAYEHTKALGRHIIENTPKDEVVVITGDVVDHGTYEEYRAALGALAELESHRNVMVCPGNHDYRLLGTFYSEGAAARFRAFRRDLTGAEHGYPYVGGNNETFRVIMLDSCAATNDMTSMAMGEIGYHQREKLAKHLELDTKPFTVVALHHHPWDRGFGLQLQDSDEFLALLAERCDVLLFGHKHEWGAWSNVWGVHKLFASGKVTDLRTLEDGEEVLEYHRITFDDDQIRHKRVKVRP